MGNCITAPFHGNYRNRSGTRAAGRDATGGGARVGADVSTGGRGSVGAGPGLGWLGLGLGRRRRARIGGREGVGIGRRRRARIGGRDASAWAARGRQEEPDRQLIPTAMGGAADGGVRGSDAGGEARRV